MRAEHGNKNLLFVTLVDAYFSFLSYDFLYAIAVHLFVGQN